MRVVVESLTTGEVGASAGLFGAPVLDMCRSSCSMSNPICAARSGGNGGEAASLALKVEWGGFELVGSFGLIAIVGVAELVLSGIVE